MVRFIITHDVTKRTIELWNVPNENDTMLVRMTDNEGQIWEFYPTYDQLFDSIFDSLVD